MSTQEVQSPFEQPKSAYDKIVDYIQAVPFFFRVVIFAPTVFSVFSLLIGFTALSSYCIFLGINFLSYFSIPDIIYVGYAAILFWIAPVCLIIFVAAIPFFVISATLRGLKMKELSAEKNDEDLKQGVFGSLRIILSHATQLSWALAMLILLVVALSGTASIIHLRNNDRIIQLSGDSIDGEIVLFSSTYIVSRSESFAAYEDLNDFGQESPSISKRYVAIKRSDVQIMYTYVNSIQKSADKDIADYNLLRPRDTQIPVIFRVLKMPFR